MPLVYPTRLCMLEMLKSINCLPNHPLRQLSSFGTGGAADLLIEVSDVMGLRAAIDLASKSNHNWSILGGGSNIIVSDDGVEEPIIQFRCEDSLERLDN